MDPFDRERQRPHGWLGVGPLASSPLEAGLGLERIEVRQGTRGGVRLSIESPRLLDGRASAPAIRALARRPRLAASGSRARSDWEWDGACLRVQVRFPLGTSFYGGGQLAAPLWRNGRAQVFWNTDTWRYGAETPGLYSSHPCVLALAPDGGAELVIADSLRRGSLAVADDGFEFAFEDEPFDLVRIEGALEEVYAEFARLTGPAALPPVWALGYHQCRWSYMSAVEALAVAREFRARDIPLDAVWLDIDHMDRARSFTFDRARFPDPRGLVGELAALGVRTVAILDPGLANDPDYAPFAEGLAGDHLLCDARGKLVLGRVWPGLCAFPDFSRAQTRAWWSERVAEFARIGLQGLWCDMNEPALFRTPTKTLPEDTRHRGHGRGSHRRFHNAYGQWMAQATRAGLERARPAARAFVLTRSSHLSSARFAATWTGDNQASWRDLAWAIPMVLSLGLSGQPFSGPDLGGFDGDPSPELFARWFDLGAYLPFARGHSEKSACRKEPWSFGPQVEAQVRAALGRRMALLPYLVTLAHEAAERGLPLARPLFFADPRDPRLCAIDDAFLLGGALLVAPILVAGVYEREVVLPATDGGWFEFPGGIQRRLEPSWVAVAPPGSTPVFARAGSIVPLAPELSRSDELAEARIELHAFLDSAGRARGRLVREEGESPDALRGQRELFEVDIDLSRTSPIRVRRRGAWRARRRAAEVVVHGGEALSRRELEL